MISDLKEADAIIGITRAISEHYKVAELSKCHSIWNAVRHKDEIVYVEEKDKFVLFCAASLSKGKGADMCTEAFALSGLAKKGYKLLIIGRQSNSEVVAKINDISIKYGIADQIVLLGYCNDIKKYMVRAASFIMSSECEGMGRVTVEAMFYGCPVIGRATGGTKEIIRHKDTGFLFTEVKECAELMKEVCTSDNTVIIRNAHDFAVRNFSVECYGEKIMKVYKSVLQ